jgi:hypothetical protein
MTPRGSDALLTCYFLLLVYSFVVAPPPQIFPRVEYSIGSQSFLAYPQNELAQFLDVADFIDLIGGRTSSP